MGLINRVIEDATRRRDKVLAGGINGIPWPMPRFSNVLPVIEQGRYYGITANQKVEA